MSILTKIIHDLKNKIDTQYPQKIEDILNSTLEKSLPAITESLMESLESQTHYMLSEHRYIRDEFIARLHRRWFEAFDSLERLIISSLEIGENTHSNFHEKLTDENKFLFESLSKLHARGIQVAKETLVLMQNGFAEGAFSRWRTLYEISVISTFIAKHGNTVAQHYIKFSSVENFNELKTYIEKHELLGFEPITPEEIKDQEKIIADLKSNYGEEFIKDYGWTKTVLDKKLRNFKGIEEDVGRDKLRPFYKFACNSVHAGSKAIHYRIGSMNHNILIAGPTNYGFADPGQCAAFAVFELTSAFCENFSDYDTKLMLNVLSHYQKEVSEKFTSIQRKLEQEELENINNSSIKKNT